jgi:glycosyltransferase involved in cell wall biosynthesis
LPVYNASEHLEEAIDSILQQTFRDFEFLIIDDGSTDLSADIVRSYSDERIRFVQNDKNRGLTFTLNRGLQLASCELVARMDADDISYPQRLEKQVRYFQDHPDCVLLSNAVRYISADKQKTRDVFFNNDFIYYNLIFTCFLNTPVTMYKRSVIVGEGGYQTEYAEDFNLYWRISRKYEFFHDNEILLDYRFSETSLSKKTRKAEYDQAECEQVKENIRFYAGEKLTFTIDEINFFRGSPKILVKTKGPGFIRNVFQKLDRLNKFVFEKEKGSARLDSIRRAAAEKKRDRVNSLRKCMSKASLLLLLFQLRYWGLLLTEAKLTLRR